MPHALRCTAAALLSLFLIGTPLLAQEGALRTSDDTRRLPLPPRDTTRDRVLVVEGGKLLNRRGDAYVDDGVLVIRGDRILQAGSRRDVDMPQRIDERIDARGLFVLPGLIDLHVHFTQQRGDDFARYRDSDAAAAIRGTLLLSQLLDAGVTAVREMGTRHDVGLRLKEAVERDLLPGPRVLWSGQFIAARGGHADEITSTATGRPKSMDSSHRVRVANGPWDWRLAVREQIRQHADWIKLTAPFTREEIAAAVDEAHQHGIPVAVDSFGEYSVWAAEAGVDSIEHPLAMDGAVVAAMRKHGTHLVPTLTAFYNVLTYGYPPAGIPAGGFYYTSSRRFPVDHAQHLESVRQARKAGIPIGVGTDIPFENERRYPDDYYVELGLLRDAGLSNAELLASATRVGAEILGIGDRLGTLEPGKLADVLIVGADPLADIDNLRDVRVVIADGDRVR